MTNEEAIEILKNTSFFGMSMDDIDSAIEMAVVALEKPQIVRCKDCRYWLPMDRFHQDYHPGRGECELNCWVRDAEWFCADGERRTE